uniref:Lipid droplet-associated hydrolase n=1 Tax=Ornithorhynchus anatinus TaxID=9258 RepID=A0A6I8NRU9_ORNAN
MNGGRALASVPVGPAHRGPQGRARTHAPGRRSCACARPPLRRQAAAPAHARPPSPVAMAAVASRGPSQEMDVDITQKEEIPVHGEFITCCGVVTQVLKCGPWTELSSNENNGNPQLLILIITGNPGIAGFYIPFLKALYAGLHKRYPVWVISHAGHIMAPGGTKVTGTLNDSGAKEVDDVFGLNGQVEHKLAFLRNHVPKDRKLILIGHSIGCYVILEMMKRAPHLQIVRSLLLFPTIERMAESPNGKIAVPLLCWLRYALYMPAYIVLKLLPESLRPRLARLLLRGLNINVNNEITVPASLTFLQMPCLANAAYLGSQEMRDVVKRDSVTIKENIKKLTFYYGAKDPWCPVEYFEDIKKDFPEGDIRLCFLG